MKNKETIIEYRKRYYIENKEKINERVRNRAILKKEEIKEYKKRYAELNKESISSKLKEHRLKNREEMNKKKREYIKTERSKMIRKLYIEKNKERIKQKNTEYRERNKERIAKKRKEYVMKNKEQFNKSKNEYDKIRRRIDPSYKIMNSLRNRLRIGLHKQKTQKNNKTMEYVGCSKKDLIIHLEKQFKPGMSWENHGEWHIDHIYPISKVDLTIEENIFKVMNWKNLQPLWAKENRMKSDKTPIVKDFENPKAGQEITSDTIDSL